MATAPIPTNECSRTCSSGNEHLKFSQRVKCEQGRIRKRFSASEVSEEGSSSCWPETSFGGSPLRNTTYSSMKKRCVTFDANSLSRTSSSSQKSTNSTFHQLEINKRIKMKHSVSCSSLPTLNSSSDEMEQALASEAPSGELDMNVSPASFVKLILLQSKCLEEKFRGEDAVTTISLRVQEDSYFVTISEDEQQAYNTTIVNAVSNSDLETLRSLHKSGHVMQTSNRFGESLLHTACRRGYTEVVEFFLNEAGVSPRVRDDMGRTPMHDTCWSSSDPNHRVMKLFIKKAPEMLLANDARGHSPFDYARREHWPSWIEFLKENRHFIERALLASCVECSTSHAEEAGHGDNCGDE